jgi:hypothetical protein
MLFRRPLPAFAAAALLVPIVTSGSAPERPEAVVSPAVAVQSPSAPSGGIRLANGTAVSLVVEIRVPEDDDCNQGRVITSATVRAGTAWVLRSSQPFCIRREKLEAGGQKRVQPWERKQPARGQVEEVVL